MKSAVAITAAFLAFLTLALPVNRAAGSPTIDICADAPLIERDHRPIFSLTVEPHQTELSAAADQILDEATASARADLVVIQIEPRLRVEITSLTDGLIGDIPQALLLHRLLSRRARLVEDGLVARGIDASDIESASSALFYRVGCQKDPEFVIFMNSPPWEWRFRNE